LAAEATDGPVAAEGFSGRTHREAWRYSDFARRCKRCGAVAGSHAARYAKGAAMGPILLPITLVTAGALAFINVWLSIRISQVRHADGVSVGDGGNERLIRRMRAQANFVENAPFVLALIGLIEFCDGSSIWLWIASAAFLIARVLHAFGMDGMKQGRNIGTGVTMALLIGLGAYAIFLPYHAGRAKQATPVDISAPKA
jgi:hypothetical protein